jgi:predicted nucleic acid-binding protein
MTLIGDTGALLALYDKDDDYHDAVLSVKNQHHHYP